MLTFATQNTNAAVLRMDLNPKCKKKKKKYRKGDTATRSQSFFLTTPLSSYSA